MDDPGTKRIFETTDISYSANFAFQPQDEIMAIPAFLKLPPL